MKKITLLLFALFISLQINAQVNSYSFSAGTTGVLDPMTGSTQLVASASDDGASAVNNIGFTFNYGGTDYTQFSANANGLVRLGATAVTTQWTNTTANVALSLPAIMPCWDDLATGSAAGGGKVHFVSTGSAPNRKLIIEWFVTIPRNTTGAANAKFQCVLNETTNVIEFVYGSGVSLDNATTGATIGLATSATIFNTVNVVANTNSSSVFKTDNITAITSGTVYTFTPPTCPGSTGMTATNITNSTATVTWVAPTPIAPASGYEYIISSSAVAPTGSGTTEASNSVNVSSLISNTLYYVYIRSNCGSEFGNWISVGTFKTLCDSLTEFVETFDTSATGVGFLPSCWAKAGTSANVYNTTGSVAPMSPLNRLYMNISATTSAFAVLPAVSNLQAETHRLKFKAYATTAGKKIRVGYFTNPADITSYVFFEEIDLPSTAATTAVEFTVVPYSIPAGVNNLVLSLPTGVATTVYVDDVKWEVNSSCVEPTVLNASMITNSSAVLSWVNGGGESEWQIQYSSTLGFSLGSGTIVSGIMTNPYVLGSLLSNTTYQYYVRGVCTGPDNSSWSGPFTFKTLCDDVTTFSENFDSYTSGVNNLPNCWSRGGNSVNTYITTGGAAPMSPLNRLYMFASSTAVPPTEGYAIMPSVSNLQANTHRLKFKAYATTNPRNLIVGYLTDPSDVSTFVTIQTLSVPGTLLANTQQFVVTPGALPVGAKSLAFKNPGFAASSATFYIDDVIWEAIPSSPPVCVTALTATPDVACGNFATTITWTPSPNTDGHYLTIGTTPGGTDVLNNQNIGIVSSYAFNGNPSTTYYYSLVPFNAVGPATGCVEQSFVTQPGICSCVPPYTTGVGSSDYFSTFILQGTTLNNNSGTSTTAPSYNYYSGLPNLTATLMQGASYTAQASVGFDNQGFAVWIDFDDNGTFSLSERVGFTTTNLTSVINTFGITIPCNANPGVHRMRVRMIYAAVGSTMDPCASATFGETEDYSITINAVPAPTGVASQTICNSGTIADLVVTASGTVNWYDAATLGALLPSATALVSGTTYYASQTVGTCESATRLAVAVTVTSQVTPTFDPVASICSGGTVPTLALTSTNGVIGTWSPATVDNMASATYTFTPDAGQCVTSTVVTLDVTVNPIPATPTGNASQTFCPADNGVLADLVVVGSNLVWYDAATNGNILPNTTAIAATTYYVASNDGTCESPRLAITTTSFCPVAPCLTDVNGQWPTATFVPNSANCDGFTSQTITTCGFASEFSVVTVVSGQTYTFASSVPTDVITISADGGSTSVASGIGSVTWVSTISGNINFYTHLDGCLDESICRTKTVTCGVISTDSPDYVNLQFPSTITVPQGGSGVVYGQVYEAGLTDVIPNIVGQAPGITAWVGISPIGANTNPNTWTNWVPATWNAGQVSNNDEYQATIGAALLPGTYYYATRFRLNTGAYVYGGIDSNGDGNFWNGTTHNSGVITITPPVAPLNDDCSGAYSVTVNSDLACGSVTAGTLIGATASATDATACFGTEDDDVWFSFVATATTHQISLNNVAGSTTDLYHSLWTGADCSSLALVPGTCSDPNTSTPVGLTIGTTYYLRVYSWTGTAGQTSTFNVCVGTFPPAPSNDICSSPLALTVGGVFTDNDIDSSNASATTSSETPIPTCGAVNFATTAKDVWYSVIVPPSGSLTIETGVTSVSATGIDTVIAAYSGDCTALVQAGCDDDGATEFTYGLSLLSLTGQTSGATILVRVFGYNGAQGNYSISAYDASLATDSFDASSFSFYPNPVKDVLNLSYSQNISKVQVINLLGQEVKSVSMNATQAQIDMENLPTGTYLVKVTSDNQVKTIKVVKQ